MGRYRIMDHNIKQRGRQWHYIRRVPEDVQPQIGKKWIEKSLKTRDKPTARRKRDAEDHANQKLWDQIRRAKEAGRASYSNDPRVEARQEHLAFQASDAARDEFAVSPDEPLGEKLEALLEVIAKENGLDLGIVEDTKKAMRLLRGTPDGQLMLEVYAAAQGSVTVDLAGDEYLKSASQAPDTKRLYRGVYRHAAKTLRPPKFVTREEARLYLQAIALANSRTTAANYRAALNNLWGHLGLGDKFWSGFKLSSPHKAIKVLKFEDAELTALLAKATRKLQIAIRIALHTGAREGEIADFVYDEKLDQIIIGKAKTEAGVRTIPCPKAIRAIVKAWVSDRWSKLTIRNRFNELKMELGFPKRAKTFHSLRHTFTSKMEGMGAQEATIARIIGHKHKEITYGRYGGKSDPESLRPLLDKLKYQL